MRHHFLIFTVFFALLSCTHDSIIPSSNSNFFPLKKDGELKFRRVGIATSYPFTNKDSLINLPDYLGANINSNSNATVSWKYEKDTVVDGKSYAKVFDKEMGTFFFRKENGIYYSRRNGLGSLQPEVIILKDNLKEGDAWTNSYFVSGNQVNEYYKVLFFKKELTVDEKIYKNVIGIRYDFGGETTVIYYSDGIGEIYSYLEYPLSFRYEHNKYYRIE